MKRRINSIVLIISITIIFLSVTAVSTNAVQISKSKNSVDYLVVDKNGDGDYKSIQTAINEAESGATIYIKNGEYPEIIDIKKCITLIGENKDETIINPISGKNKYAIQIGAPGAVVKNLCISNGAPGLYSSGIRITVSSVEIIDCDFYNTPIGIVVWSSENTVNGCRFWNCNDEGIALIGSSYSKCDKNIITNCKFYDNCDGIELQYSSSNTIENCDFYDNTHVGIDAIASDNNKNTISNCKIYDNDVYGIYLSSSSDNEIIDCDIYDNDNGDIIMNKNSKNNQIITSDDSDDEGVVNGNPRLLLLRNILTKLSRIYSGRIIDLTKHYNF